MQERKTGSPQKPNNEPSDLAPHELRYSELLANWIGIYTAEYGEPMEEKNIAYKIGLSDLPNLKILHDAFGRCLKACDYWPKVSEIRQAYAIKAEEVSPSRSLPEADPEWTANDRQTWAELMQQTGEKLKVPRKVAPLSNEEFSKRKLLLKKQAEELTAKAKGVGK